MGSSKHNKTFNRVPRGIRSQTHTVYHADEDYSEYLEVTNYAWRGYISTMQLAGRQQPPCADGPGPQLRLAKERDRKNKFENTHPAGPSGCLGLFHMQLAECLLHTPSANSISSLLMPPAFSTTKGGMVWGIRRTLPYLRCFSAAVASVAAARGM